MLGYIDDRFDINPEDNSEELRISEYLQSIINYTDNTESYLKEVDTSLDLTKILG